MGAVLARVKRQAVRCAVDRDEALRYLGYRGQHIDDALAARFENLAKRCETENVAQYCWKVLPIDTKASRWLGAEERDPVVALQGTDLKLAGASINQHLRDATYAALLCATLGLGNERKIGQLKALSPADAAMYSCCSSSLVEAAAIAAEAAIKDAMADANLFCNGRFSPGYGDLPLDVQGPFLATLDTQRSLGVTVTPGNLLLPTKSITAVMGVFTQPPKTSAPSPCDDCRLRFNCSYREKGTTCHGQ